MARAVRSPGSALKPFIYAMAFDRLIIHPETVLEDRPRHFGDYAPSDFDGRFQGDVSARQALQYSLNLPAVAVLDRLGPARFTAALAAAGVRLQLPEPTADPGLAVALGGAGITLADLVRLYAALSNGGEVTPLRYRRDDRRSRVRRFSGRSGHGMSTTSWPRRHRRPASCRPRSAAAGGSPSRPERPTAFAISGRSATIPRSRSASGRDVPTAPRCRAAAAG